MDAETRVEARVLLTRSPCSVEMPAGTGKTELVAAMVLEAANDGAKSLVLTHTNAGVNALRTRLSRYGVDPRSYHIDTITGWALDLVRSYPVLAELVVDNFKEKEAATYALAAVKVANALAIKRVLAASFQYLLVDEYQDCTVDQHKLVIKMTEILPRCVVLGDRLQGIFDFGETELIDWDRDVFALFPLQSQRHIPRRWQTTNPALGEWLLAIRETFVNGGQIDLSDTSIVGLKWRKLDSNNERSEAYAAARSVGSSVLLHGHRNMHLPVARTTKGTYSIMEDLAGSYMSEQLEKLNLDRSETYALWLASTANNCFSGLKKSLDKTLLGRLQSNKSILDLKRPEVPKTITVLEALRLSPNLTTLADSMVALSRANEGNCYAYEAWYEMYRTIRRASLDSTADLPSHLASVRQRVRHTGRMSRKNWLSRTVLVKGLEYDNVVISNMEALGNRKHIYVALTRPRKTLTVLSNSPIIEIT